MIKIKNPPELTRKKSSSKLDELVAVDVCGEASRLNDAEC